MYGYTKISIEPYCTYTCMPLGCWPRSAQQGTHAVRAKMATSSSFFAGASLQCILARHAPRNEGVQRFELALLLSLALFVDPARPRQLCCGEELRCERTNPSMRKPAFETRLARWRGRRWRVDDARVAVRATAPVVARHGPCLGHGAEGRPRAGQGLAAVHLGWGRRGPRKMRTGYDVHPPTPRPIFNIHNMARGRPRTMRSMA
jgi:hypothetical protein